MSDLQPLIDQAEKSEFSHVVVFLSDEGIHWRPQTESACKVMAEILESYGAKAMPKADFLEVLRKSESDGDSCITT